MRIVVQLCWLITGLAAAYATWFLFIGVTTATGAPQEAAAAAIAAAIAILPYVFTRGLEGAFLGSAAPSPARREATDPAARKPSGPTPLKL